VFHVLESEGLCQYNLLLEPLLSNSTNIFKINCFCHFPYIVSLHVQNSGYNFVTSREDSITNIVNNWLDDSNCGLTPGRGRKFSMLQWAESGSLDHPASHLIGNRALDLEVKWLGGEADHVHLSSTKVENE
jgi:hypothetical protein